MAKLIQAVQRYGPRIELNQTVQIDELAEWISGRTGLNKSELVMTLLELNEAITYFSRRGTPLKLPDVGTFAPSIAMNGVIKVKFRPDTTLRKVVGSPASFVGRIRNQANIGITNEQLKALWDADFPDDPLQL